MANQEASNKKQKPGNSKAILEPFLSAPTRGDLCETLSWYCNNEGSLYLHSNLVHGIMLRDSDAPECRFIERVIITRLTTDSNARHAMKRVADAHNTKKKQHLVGVVFEKQFFSKLPAQPAIDHSFLVAGWFLITHIWMGVNGIPMVRLEYVGADDGIWWAAACIQEASEADVETEKPPIALQGALEQRRCPSCEEESPVILEEGWTCGFLPEERANRDPCKLVGKKEDQVVPQTQNYRDAFVYNRFAVSPASLPSLIPPLPKALNLDVDDFNTCASKMRAMWRGFVCPKCSTCYRRLLHTKYICSTCHHRVDCGPPILPIDLVDDSANLFVALQPDNQIPDLKLYHGIKIAAQSTLDGYFVTKIQFTDSALLYLLYATRPELDKKGGSRDVFHELQTTAAGETVDLARRGVHGKLTRHFEFNAGRRYKAGMSLDTTAFEEAPEVFERSKDHLSRVISNLLQRDPGFNEALTCEYWTGMGMGAHDDGEEGLGDVVASLSVGSKAQMRFIMKPAYRYGRTRKGREIILTPDDPILPGCAKEAERRLLKTEKEAGNLSEEDYSQRLSALLQDLPVSVRHTLPVLNCTLPHGTIMCMVGRDMQKFFEHEILELKGLMRFAVTCRHIGDTHGQPSKKGSSSTKREGLGRKRAHQEVTEV